LPWLLGQGDSKQYQLQEIPKVLLPNLENFWSFVTADIVSCWADQGAKASKGAVAATGIFCDETFSPESLFNFW
jgi:hypothetical protein